MNDTIKHITASLKNTYSYSEYEKLIEDLLNEGKSTTKGADEDLVHYSELGLQRMRRWDKKLDLDADLSKKVNAFDKKQIWIVIAEGWCGDAAHTVPVIHKMTEMNKNINLRIVLREENLDLMNDFLTNGSKSIPKLIVYNPEDQKVEADWGPRPAGAKDIFEKYRKEGFETMEPKLQAWYNKDKGQTTAKELLALLK